MLMSYCFHCYGFLLLRAGFRRRLIIFDMPPLLLPLFHASLMIALPPMSSLIP